MRRGQRQKLDGDGWEWVHLSSRRFAGLTRRPGVGRYTKRKMARQRRREHVRPDDE